jgi:hypothetical protein
LPQDPKGIIGPKIPLDDVVTILEPKEEISPAAILAAQQQHQMYTPAPPVMVDPAVEADGMDPSMQPVDPAAAAGF